MKKLDEDIFESLTPRSDEEVDKDCNYEKTLKWALDKNDLKNIALSGNYGSGKSSIIEKFVTTHKEYNYFKICLANFINENSKGDRQIEAEVLQQLFYTVAPNTIPYSRFKKINNITPKIFAMRYIFSLITIVLGILCLVPKSTKSVSSIISNMEFNKWISIFIIILFIACANIFLYKLFFYIFRRYNLSKFKIEKAGLEFDKDKEESIFNKYLDEIIYFFEATNYDVLIFEDLDRYEQPSIFIKLRELNAIINNYENINRKIVFIYAIKDDMFCNSERTKFFDFIIPVIPFINSSNSFEVLRKKIRELDILEDKISDRYLKDVCFYIDDMRMLLNIQNEFIIYWTKLSRVHLNSENLLSLIIYKNLCPSDFSKLQINKGLIPKAFISEKESRINIENEYKGDNEKLAKIIENIDNEIAISTSDLNAIFVSKICKAFSTKYCNILYDESLVEQNDFIDMEIDYSKFKGDSTIQIIIGSTPRNRTLSQIEDYNFLLEEFISRQEILIIGKEEKKQHIFQEIQNIDNKIKSLKTADFEERNEIINYIFDEKEYSIGKNIIPFMLRRGYIKENFSSFISYFHEGSLTIEDMNYVMSIKDQKELDYYYKLMNVEEIVYRLDVRDFKTKNFYNLALVKYLFTSTLDNSMILNQCNALLFDGSPESKDFIKAMLNEPTLVKLYLVNICLYWKDIWKWISEESEYPDKKVKELFDIIIENVSLQDILNFTKVDSFTDYVSKQRDFLVYEKNENISIEKLKNLITKLNIEFIFLNNLSKKSDLSLFIMTKFYFDINIEMLDAIIGIDLNVNEMEIYKKARYTYLSGHEFEWILSYLQENMELFINNIILNKNDNFEEDEFTIFLMLDNIEDTKLMEKILKKQNTIISSINLLPSIMWVKSFELHKIEINWDNIFEFYNAKKNISVIGKYIKENASNLGHSEVDYNSYELGNECVEAIFKIKELELKEFRNIIKAFSISFSEMVLTELSDEKIILLINKKKLSDSVENYNELRNRKNRLNVYFICVFYNEFLKRINEFEVDDVDIINILKFNKINDIQKKKILDNIPQEKLYFSNQVSIATTEFLLKTYEENGIEFNLFKGLIGKLKNKEIISLLLKKEIPRLTNQEIVESLKTATWPFNEIVILRKKPQLDDNEVNREIVDALQRKKIISSSKTNAKGKICISTKTL